MGFEGRTIRIGDQCDTDFIRRTDNAEQFLIERHEEAPTTLRASNAHWTVDKRFDLEKVLCAWDRKEGGKRAVSMTKQAANRIHLRNLSVIQRRVESLTAPEVQHVGSVHCVRSA